MFIYEQEIYYNASQKLDVNAVRIIRKGSFASTEIEKVNCVFIVCLDSTGPGHQVCP